MDLRRSLIVAAALVAIGATGVLAQPDPDATQQTAQALTEAS